MLAQLNVSTSLPKTLNAAHLPVLSPKGRILPHDVFHRKLPAAVLKRRGIKAGETGVTPVAANAAAEGSMIVWAMLDFATLTGCMWTCPPAGAKAVWAALLAM